MRKITLLFFVSMASMLMWTSTYAQSVSCSQETMAGTTVENGYGYLNTLIFANDLVVNANEAFTLNSVQFNALVPLGVSIDGVKLHFYKNSTSGTGPGVELSATAMQAPTSATVIGEAFGHDRVQVNLDLAVPFTFMGETTETIFWIGVLVQAGGNSYIEVVTAMNTPNESYFLADGVWVPGSDPVNGFDETADGVISFYGDCDAITACSGMPDAGVAQVSPTSGGVGSAYSVSATGYSSATEMSFQWQSNTNGQGWVDEGAATNEVLAYNATAPAEVGDVVEWRLVSTCTASGDTAMSTVATFTTVIAYCESADSSPNFENITNVTYAGINNTTSSHAPYNDFTNQVATVNVGDTNQISVQLTVDGNDYLYVFIDWNQNGTLDDAGEVYTLASATSSVGPHTMDITVPADAVLGNTRMRVKVGWYEDVADPCNSFDWGEIEDYTVLVQDATTSINDYNMLVGTRVFPNPLSDNTFYVHAPKLNGQQVEVNIADMAGRRIFTNTLTAADNKVTVSLNNELNSGVYLVTLKHGTETHTLRLVKE